MNYLKTPWTSQPQQAVGIDWGNPITRGLVAVINPASGDGSKVGSVSLSARRYGLSHAGNGSSYISKPTPSFGSAATILHVGNIQFDNSGANLFAAVGTSGSGNQVFGFQGSSGSQNGRAVIRVVNTGSISSAEIDTAAGVTAPEAVWVAVYDGSVNINVFQDGRYCVSGRANISASGAMSSMDNFTLGGVNRGTDSFAQSGQVSTLGLAWNRALSTAEVQSISQNPWQIFKPLPRRIFVPVSAVSDILATLNVTEGAETLTSSGTVSGATGVTGTASLTESAETLTASGAVTVGATLSQTEAAETLSAAGTVLAVVTGTLSQTEAAETLSSAGTIALGAALSQTESPETASSSGTVAVSASLSQTETTETLSASGTVVSGVVGTASINEVAETLAAAGTLAIGGAASVTNDAQTVTASGAIQITGAGNLIELAETLTASGIALGGITGSANLTLAAQTLSAFGTVASQTIARPSTDTSNSGWTPSTGSDLYAMIDEVSPDDADYISTNSAGSVCRLGLGAVADPGTSSGQVVSYRASSSTGNGLRVELMQGGTVIATWNHATLPATDTTYQQSLSAAECDAITDYTALSVRLTSL